MAFTAAVVVRRGGWAKCMLVSAVIMLVGVTVEAYGEPHSVGRTGADTISAAYVEAPPNESALKVDRGAQQTAGPKRASSFKKRYLVIATLLLVAIGMLIHKGGAFVQRLEAKAQRAKLQKEKAQKETAQKDKILVDILNSFIGKLIDAEHHIDDDINDFKDRLKHIDNDIDKFKSEMRHEFKDIRDLFHKIQDALSNKDYDEIALILKEESDQETLVGEVEEGVIEVIKEEAEDAQTLEYELGHEMPAQR